MGFSSYVLTFQINQQKIWETYIFSSHGTATVLRRTRLLWIRKQAMDSGSKRWMCDFKDFFSIIYLLYDLEETKIHSIGCGKA